MFSSRGPGANTLSPSPRLIPESSASGTQETVTNRGVPLPSCLSTVPTAPSGWLAAPRGAPLRQVLNQTSAAPSSCPAEPLGRV
ncbi:unnamed protein product [Arctogadus glacialis]